MEIKEEKDSAYGCSINEGHSVFGDKVQSFSGKKRRKNLSIHQNKVHSNGNFKCKECGHTFRNRQYLRNHRSRYHSKEKDKNFECKDCGKRFISNDTLKNHSYTHSNVRSFKCTICFKMYKSDKIVKEHLRNVHSVGKPKNRKKKIYIRETVKCVHCNKTFASPHTLSEHVRVVHRGLPIDIPDGEVKCKICKELFDGIESLKDHVKVHLVQPVEKPFECAICGLKYSHLHKIRRHMNKTHIKKSQIRLNAYKRKYDCPICGKPCNERSRFEDHIETHSNETKSCSQCPKVFATDRRLQKHVEKMHGEEKYPCEICEKRYTTVEGLKKHTRLIHTKGGKKFPCDVCGKIFKSNWRKQGHMKAHSRDYSLHETTEKPPRVLRERKKKEPKMLKSTINDGIQAEKDKKQAKGSNGGILCEKCPKKFATEDELRAHAIVHVKKTYKCSFCGRELKTRDTLNRHEKTHKRGRTKINCAYCNRKFWNTAELKRHTETVHHGLPVNADGPLSCTICNETFENLETLEDHVQIHPNDAFQCGSCDETFYSKAEIEKHIRKIHNKKFRFLKENHPGDPSADAFSSVASSAYASSADASSANASSIDASSAYASSVDAHSAEAAFSTKDPLFDVEIKQEVVQDEEILSDFPSERNIKVEMDGDEMLFTVTEISDTKIKMEVDPPVVVKEEPREEGFN
uniref:C2H2-type domain-containing protein n=2 Tax=Lutzomyia longipalpis TaxID=7200 RepID=A0A1B0GKT4_LUTLO